MNRPQQQTNFLPVTDDFAPSPPCVDLRGDIRVQTADRLDPATGLTPKQQLAVDTHGADPGMFRWYNENQPSDPLPLQSGMEDHMDATRYGADPLPAPPGWHDDDLPDDGPVSPTMLAMAWRTGQAHVDAIASGTYAEFVEKRQARQRLQEQMDADLRRGLERLREQFPPAEAGTRYVEGLAHTEPPHDALRATEGDYRPPQGVPDGYGPRAPYVAPLEADPEAIDAEERVKFGSWFGAILSDAKVVLALLVFGAVGGLALAAIWAAGHK